MKTNPRIVHQKFTLRSEFTWEPRSHDIHPQFGLKRLTAKPSKHACLCPNSGRWAGSRMYHNTSSDESVCDNVWLNSGINLLSFVVGDPKGKIDHLGFATAGKLAVFYCCRAARLSRYGVYFFYFQLGSVVKLTKVYSRFEVALNCWEDFRLSLFEIQLGTFWIRIF